MGNGAYYHNGSIYFAQEGNYTVPGGIVKMDPITLETEVVLNNWYGHRFNSPNDVVITRDGVAYFTDGYYGYDNFNDTLKPELANGVWRWEMTTGDIRMFTGAGGGTFTNPNGVALNLEEDKLYVTNRGNASDNPAGGRTIYEFDLNKEGLPVTGGTVFSYQDSGFPDGIKLDADGRMYGSATGGVNVYDKTGRQMGIIRVAEGDVSVNMEWIGDWLYIAGREFLYRVQLKTRGAQSKPTPSQSNNKSRY
jgi:gluconolactonase